MWWRVVVVLVAVVGLVVADWDLDCPQGCKCTYVSNRKMADCRHAGFSTVPTSLSPEVQELNLASNNIRYLEKDAFRKAGLVNLQKLYLSGNQIGSVHKDAFRDLKIMIELDLRDNKIDKLHPHTFTGLEKLRVLDLSVNGLSRLDGVQFPPLPHLRKLYLRDNQLSYIHNYAFSNLHILDSLRLSGNRLKSVAPELFSNNSHLVALELHDNPWECDCKLRPLVHWAKEHKLLQEHVMCGSPERVSGRRWESIDEDELACRPEVVVGGGEVPAVEGQNASVMCRASGEPLPHVKWVLHGRVLTNMSVIPGSEPEQRYVVREAVEAGERRSQLTVTRVRESDFTYYTCVADNVAGLVEHNVTLVAAAPTITGAITPRDSIDIYIIIGIAAAGVLLLLLILLCICCCWRHRRRRAVKQRSKVNGSAGGHMENVMIVNPVEKPPRRYEQLPQTDIELSGVIPGHHRSYDEVDYPEATPSGAGTHRTPLAILEEEEDAASQDTTLDAGGSSVADYLGHYPDLLDMTRPRTVSPTQLSYHSLMAPHALAHMPPGLAPSVNPGAEWRYSYVHPAEYPQYPVAFAPPRPGYVTLPRRHRTPSWAGQSSLEGPASPPPPGMEGERPLDPIYDTLGPRTTLSGTSRTDLTRPATTRHPEPFTPRTPTSPASPPTLTPAYNPATPQHYNRAGPPAAAPRNLHHQRHHSSTLPRSTPNLLDGTSLTLPSQPIHEGVPAKLVTTHIPAHSPTPSTASTARTASPHYRAASPAVPTPPLNGHTTPSRSPLASSNESTLDTTLNNNNNFNTSNNNTSPITKPLDVSVASITSATSTKKVPPKPPPKPSAAKRLSLASATSTSQFQDEGPDGTEV